MTTLAMRCVTGDKAQGDPPLLPAPLMPQADPAVLDDFRNSLNIKRSPTGSLVGAPVVSAKSWGSWTFNDPPDGVTVAGIFERLVRAYLWAQARGQRDEADTLRAACYDLCDHLLDQGFAEGNNNISCAGFPIKCVLTLRRELTESGRLRDMLLASAACGLQIRGDALLHEDWSRVGFYPRNTDLSPDYLSLLALTVLLPVEAERLQRLDAYSRAVSCLCDPELGEPYAWDGTGHHHGMFHTAYTGGVFTKHAYALRGTDFKLSPAALGLLKRSDIAYAFHGRSRRHGATQHSRLHRPATGNLGAHGHSADGPVRHRGEPERHRPGPGGDLSGHA